MNKKIFAAILTILMVFCLVACNDNEADPTQDENTTSAVTSSGQVIIDQQLSVLASAQEENQQNEVDMIQVTLYFASNDGSKLVKETRMIPKEEGIARATINELILGPDDDELTATLPTGTELMDINIKDGVCIVDFNNALKDGIDTVEEENICVYSIVNTLTQFDTVDEVKILVDGKNIDQFAGALDISTTIAPNMDIVEP